MNNNNLLTSLREPFWLPKPFQEVNPSFPATFSFSKRERATGAAILLPVRSFPLQGAAGGRVADAPGPGAGLVGQGAPGPTEPRLCFRVARHPLLHWLVFHGQH